MSGRSAASKGKAKADNTVTAAGASAPVAVGKATDIPRPAASAAATVATSPVAVATPSSAVQASAVAPEASMASRATAATEAPAAAKAVSPDPVSTAAPVAPQTVTAAAATESSASTPPAAAPAPLPATPTPTTAASGAPSPAAAALAPATTPGRVAATPTAAAPTPVAPATATVQTPPSARPAVMEAVAEARAAAKSLASLASGGPESKDASAGSFGSASPAPQGTAHAGSGSSPARASGSAGSGAQVPAPSVVGVPGVPQAASSEASATSRFVPTSGAPEPPVPRQAAAQLAGVSPVSRAAGFDGPAATRALEAAAAAVATKQPALAPPHAVEIVSRAPQLAGTALPPVAVAMPEVAAVGPATALKAVGEAALAAGARASETAAAVPLVPKDGPPAVAVGRAALRGACPVLTSKAGQPATSIAKRYQIVFVSAEVAPWSKTGGLGEAMDGLPIALAALGHRVMTIAPRYDQYKEAWDTGYWSHVPMGSTAEPVHAFHAYISQVDRVFVDHDCFLAKVAEKTGSMLYGPAWGKDYMDNQWRYAYFAKAALKIVQELPLGGFPYGSETIIIANDWHSSLVPLYLHVQKAALPAAWAGTKSALLIHNAVFQGRFDRDDTKQPGEELYNLPEVMLRQFTFNMATKVGRTNPKVERCLNWMAAGAQFADRVLTVSPTYAWELLNLPEMGVELEGLFARTGVTGIVNGVKEMVSPTSEAFAAKAEMLGTFGVADVDEKKAVQKAALQERYGLPVSPSTPLCVFVGRMDLQKGYDYLLSALSAVLDTLDLQVVIVGTGRADLVAASKALAAKHPTKLHLGGWMGPERYALVAGADFNLMPSRWEPCGLAQMESMRFGTLPLVAQTGGLVDTVDDLVTGLHLDGAVSVESEPDAASVELVARGLERLVALYRDSRQVSQMRRAAMAAGAEYTWSNAALQYEAVCEELGVKDVLPLCRDRDAGLVTLTADKVVA